MGESKQQMSQKQLEEFERFMMGQMTEEEEVGFTQKLDKQPDLQEQFKEFKEIFRDLEEYHLREAMEDYHQDMVDEKPIKRLLPQFYPVAAGIALLLTLGFWYLNQTSPNEKLFDQYYNPDPGLPTVMSTASNYEFYEAMVEYKEGKYSSAIMKWQALEEQGTSTDTLMYFLGSAHMANRSYDQAQIYLEQLLKKEATTFRQEANFQMGLILLKNNQVEEARSFLMASGLKESKTLLQELDR
jgi:tetratricopeptide (TPR) repeat protein